MPTFMDVYAASEKATAVPGSVGDLVRMNSSSPVATPASIVPGAYSPGGNAVPLQPTSVLGQGAVSTGQPITSQIIPSPRAQPTAILGDVPTTTSPGGSISPTTVSPAQTTPPQAYRGGSVPTATPQTSNPTPRLNSPVAIGANVGVAVIGAVGSIALGGDPTVAVAGAVGQVAGGVIGGTLGGPVGAFVGGMLGGFIGSAVGGYISGRNGFQSNASPTKAPPTIPVNQPSSLNSDGVYQIRIPYTSKAKNGTGGTISATLGDSATGANLAAKVAAMMTYFADNPGSSVTNTPSGVNITTLSPGTTPLAPVYPDNSVPFGNPQPTPTDAPQVAPKDGSPVPAIAPLIAPGIQQGNRAAPTTVPTTPGTGTGTPPVPTKPTVPIAPITPPVPGTGIPFIPVPSLNPSIAPNITPTKTSTGVPLAPLYPGSPTSTPTKAPAKGSATTPTGQPEFQPEIKPETPTTTKSSADKCCESNSADLALIKKILGVKDFPATLPLLTGDKMEEVTNIPELIVYGSKNLDAVVGLFPMKINALGGNGQTSSITLESISHAIQELFAVSLTMAEDANAGVNIGARIATEVINTKVKATQTAELIQSIIKWTGIAIAPIPQKIKLNFTPSAAGINNKLENNEMEDFLKPSERFYVGSECAEKDQLLPIVNRMLQNTEISRASVWHPIRPTGAKNDNFIGTATKRANKKASKAEDALFNKLLEDLKKQGYDFDTTGNEGKKQP